MLDDSRHIGARRGDLVYQLGARRIDGKVIGLQADLLAEIGISKPGQHIQATARSLDDSPGTKEFAQELLQAQIYLGHQTCSASTGLTVQVEKVTRDTKSVSSNFACERVNYVDMSEDLPDVDRDVGVDSVQSGGAGDVGQPAGGATRDLPRFGCFRRWQFDPLSFFLTPHFLPYFSF